MLGIITAHFDIEKLNERGKKRLNAKLECHLAKSHTGVYEVLPSGALILHLAFFYLFH